MSGMVGRHNDEAGPSSGPASISAFKFQATKKRPLEIVKVKRRRDQAGQDELVLPERRQRKPKKRKEDLSVAFGNLKLGDGKFNATIEDTWNLRGLDQKKRVFRRVGTLTAKELKDGVVSGRKLRAMLNRATNPYSRKDAASEFLQCSHRRQQIRADAQEARSRDRYQRFKERRKTRSFFPNQSELVEKFYALQKQMEKQRTAKKSAAALLAQDYMSNDITDEERKSLLKYCPLIKEHLINEGMTEDEAKVAFPDEECEYDIYVREGSDGFEGDGEFVTYGEDEENSENYGDDDEDSNAEGWHGNDYPDEDEGDFNGDDYNTNEYKEDGYMDNDMGGSEEGSEDDSGLHFV